MNKDELFKLYEKVLKKDKSSEDILIEEHRKKFPKNQFHVQGLNRSTDPYYRSTLHMMYLHLTRNKK